MDIFPRERASALSYDVAGYGAEFVEKELRAARERVSDLAYPAGVGVRGGLMGFVRLGRGGIQVGLRVMVRGKMNKVFGEGWCVGMIYETEGGGAD